MIIYYEQDIVWALDFKIACAKEMNKKIALIELDVVESQAFIDQVSDLTKSGVVVRSTYEHAYFYKQIKIKLNTK